ncbi:MAG: GDP-mannose 4,6-dehydratase, partial [Moorella sp. (in: Bacteria)]|nr:GDP-mannose 4,6-dehydratase [Moorella sp. (in: firmicutes)]
GAGFIGSNFIRYFLEKYSYQLVNLDKLTYAGNLENLDDVKDDPRYAFVRGDIADGRCVEEVFSRKIDVVVNFAAESHVDRSIEDAGAFIRTNVEGTRVLLDAARRHGVERFVQISTDEVYGSLGPKGRFTEDSPLNPSSPYSASKAAADLLALAYHKTYGLPVIVTRCSNNYGPYQFPEKLIPLMITNA